MKKKLMIGVMLLLGLLVITLQAEAVQTTTFTWPKKIFDENSESQRKFYVVLSHRNNRVIKEEVIDEYYFSEEDKDMIFSFIYAAESLKISPEFTSPYFNMSLHKAERYFKSVVTIDTQKIKKSNINEYQIAYIGEEAFDEDGIVKFDLMRDCLIRTGFNQE